MLTPPEGIKGAVNPWMVMPYQEMPEWDLRLPGKTCKGDEQNEDVDLAVLPAGHLVPYCIGCGSSRHHTLQCERIEWLRKVEILPRYGVFDGDPRDVFDHEEFLEKLTPRYSAHM